MVPRKILQWLPEEISYGVWLSEWRKGQCGGKDKMLMRFKVMMMKMKMMMMAMVVGGSDMQGSAQEGETWRDAS